MAPKKDKQTAIPSPIQLNKTTTSVSSTPTTLDNKIRDRSPRSTDNVNIDKEAREKSRRNLEKTFISTEANRSESSEPATNTQVGVDSTPAEASNNTTSQTEDMDTHNSEEKVEPTKIFNVPARFLNNLRLLTSEVHEKLTKNMGLQIVNIEHSFIEQTITFYPGNPITSKQLKTDIPKEAFGGCWSYDFTEFTGRPRPNKPTLIILRGIPLDTTVEDVKQDLDDQNIPNLEVTRIKASNTGRTTTLMKVSIPDRNTANRLVDSGFKLFGLIVIKPELARMTPQVTQCGRCQALGHTTNNCRNITVCPKCSGAHSFTECTTNADKIKCINCGGAHSPRYRGCSAYQTQYRLESKSNTDTSARRYSPREHEHPQRPTTTKRQRTKSDTDSEESDNSEIQTTVPNTQNTDEFPSLPPAQQPPQQQRQQQNQKQPTTQGRRTRPSQQSSQHAPPITPNNTPPSRGHRRPYSTVLKENRPQGRYLNLDADTFTSLTTMIATIVCRSFYDHVDFDTMSEMISNSVLSVLNLRYENRPDTTLIGETIDSGMRQFSH